MGSGIRGAGHEHQQREKGNGQKPEKRRKASFPAAASELVMIICKVPVDRQRSYGKQLPDGDDLIIKNYLSPRTTACVSSDYYSPGASHFKPWQAYGASKKSSDMIKRGVK
jgi:hypothetical protein